MKKRKAKKNRSLKKRIEAIERQLNSLNLAQKVAAEFIREIDGHTR